MTELHLTLTTSSDQQFQIATRLQQKMFGLPAIILLMAAFQFGGDAATWASTALTGEPLSEVLEVAVVSALGAFGAFILYQNWMVPRLRRELARSGLRRAPVSISLTKDGLVLHPVKLQWEAVTSTVRWDDATVLLFSRLDALVISDADLPPELSQHLLSNYISDWRAK